jgi:hypothetical protein
MATIVMDTDECEFEGDALMLDECGDEVMCAGWNPQLALAANSTAEQINKRAKDRKRTSAAQSSELEEVVDRIEFVRSTAFPQCP